MSNPRLILTVTNPEWTADDFAALELQLREMLADFFPDDVSVEREEPPD
jgi:hypothetical protein